jgi:hypothetical protein
MVELQLSIRSTRARKLANKLAKQEQRTVTQVVEQALERYAQASTGRTARPIDPDFWRRMARENAAAGGPDIDLDAIIREGRKPHEGIDL